MKSHLVVAFSAAYVPRRFCFDSFCWSVSVSSWLLKKFWIDSMAMDSFIGQLKMQD